jgi:hypothetical protein
MVWAAVTESRQGMSNRQRRTLCVALLLLLDVLGCIPSSTPTSVPIGGAVDGGSTIELNGFWWQYGGMCIEDDSPGVVFGMTKKPGGEREFAYLLIFKHPENSKFDHVASLSAPGAGLIKIIDHLGYGSGAIDLKLESTVDAAAKTPKREHLTIDGNDFDPSQGRVFLVDLRTAAVKPEQVQAKFPRALPEPKGPTNVRSIVANVLETLGQESPTAREFLSERIGASRSK